MRGSWDRDVVPNYDGPIYHRPADANYDLHFHLPTTPLQVRKRQWHAPQV